MSKKVVSFRKLVMYADLNNNGKMFGGALSACIDESAALYVMCQLKTANVVTVKISSLIFKEPVRLGDFLEFEAETLNIGRTSITVGINVFKKDVLDDSKNVHVTSAELTFVHIDPLTEKAIPHILPASKVP